MIIIGLVTLLGVVDQFDNGIASIEWSNGSWTELRADSIPIKLKEGTQIRIEWTTTASPLPSSQKRPSRSASTDSVNNHPQNHHSFPAPPTAEIKL